MDSSVVNQEIHLYFHKYLTEEDTLLANFDFKLMETLIMTGNERVLIKQCVLPKFKLKFNAFFVTLNRYKIRVEEKYISSPFDICDTLNSVFKKLKSHLGFQTPVINYDKSEEKSLQLIIPRKQSLKVSRDIGNLLFQGRTKFRNRKAAPVIYWFKIQQNFEDVTFYLICDLLQKSIVGHLQLPLINTLIVQNKKDTSYSHLLWNNDLTQGKSFLRAGAQRNIKLSIVDKEGNFARLKGGVFFIHLKICI